ncbi:MAG TPA: poly-gamma-glutamate biosynthesis protein PgsC [candidate division Zixibacteria bacterium]|nr:poly-gamma-glutamate biosynthesis protein PgsC [candidate division Zixibacteria bacterium]
MLWLSVGLGLILSLGFAEWFGLAAGGLVVPGYIALFWSEPFKILGTVAIGLAAFGTVKVIAQYTLIYGRRKLVLMVLVAFVFAWLFRWLLRGEAGIMLGAFDPIGFIIPGLLAYWMDRQGVIDTLTTMVIASVIVRLLLIIFMGGELIEVALPTG